MNFRREDMVAQLADRATPWDLVIIGGGATGLGTAIDASSRGYRTLLIERSDFAQATSSRSTKLVHGGVRYLRQGNVALVRGALRERGLLRLNASHLVRDLAFVIPNYAWWEGPYYGLGLRAYDWLAGRLSLGPSRNLSRDEAIDRVPTLSADGLRGGVMYYDAQFDDARLAINMAQTAAEHGAAVINYVEATALTKSGGKVTGVVARDLESGDEYELKAKVVINATGVFTDAVRRLDRPDAAPIIAPSQGVHLVLDRSFLPGDSALMVPRTDDGRVMFAIPWQGVVVVGTTDTPVQEPSVEPRPLDEELDFLTRHVARYLGREPKPEDVKSTFAGLRPLVKAGSAKNTAALSRDHTLRVSSSGLLTIAGGKWTTYRKMAEDTIDRAAAIGGLEPVPCRTPDVSIRGHATTDGPWAAYGADAAALSDLIAERAEFAERVHPDLALVAGQVVWAARQEMARTVEDVLSRRVRCLLLDARASLEMAPAVAEIMAAELGRDAAWQQAQVRAYSELAQDHLMS